MAKNKQKWISIIYWPNQEYRRKTKVYVWKWEGDTSIVDEINKVIEDRREYHDPSLGDYKAVINDNGVLCLGHEMPGGMSFNSFLSIGDYVVYDEDEDERLRERSERELNNMYKKPLYPACG